LIEETQITQQSKVDQQSANAQKNASERKKSVVEISKLDRYFADRSEYYENVVKHNYDVPQIQELHSIRKLKALL
jgi:hypothetical protein